MQQRVDLDRHLAEVRPLDSGGLLAQEDVIGPMRDWLALGERCALVTLVGVEGGAPRHVGAQMAVSASGRSAGYLSGGCLEQAIVLEAREAIAQRLNRMVRYGRGSRYVDIRLPCGSGLDVYFDQSLSLRDVDLLARHESRREPMCLTTDLTTGMSTVAAIGDDAPTHHSRLLGHLFKRVYLPPVQLLLVGSGPGLLGIASLAAAVGLSLRLVPLDDATQTALLHAGFFGFDSLDAAIPNLDSCSAAVVVLHDHDREPDILARLLGTDCFYIGVLGNHAVHRARLAALSMRGFDAAQCSRLHAPIGAIPGAKTAATLAIGVVMELMADAKARGLIG